MKQTNQLLGAAISGFISLIVFSGCKDISEVAPQKESAPTPEVVPVQTEAASPTNSQPVTPAAETSRFPFDRMIADSEGRKIDVKILAKAGDKIGLLKTDDLAAFVFPIERLSDADQSFFGRLEDGGNLREVEQMVSRRERLAGRVAVWNPQHFNAENEADKLKIPLLTVFVFNDDARSASLERKVLYSKEFRNWANQNLVLCLIRLEKTTSNRAPGLADQDKREVSSRFGVKDDIAFVLSPVEGVPVLVSGGESFSSGNEAIAAISEVISNPSQGEPTSSIPIPTRSGQSKGGKGGGKGGGGKGGK